MDLERATVHLWQRRRRFGATVVVAVVTGVVEVLDADDGLNRLLFCLAGVLFRFLLLDALAAALGTLEQNELNDDSPPPPSPPVNNFSRAISTL